MALFEIRGLRKRFGDNLVLDGVDLDIFDGERITLIGESGSGKSVLLKHLIGLLRPDAGTIAFDGQDVTRLPEKDWIEIRKRIGMLFQWDALFDSLTVGDNVAYALREQRVLDEAAIQQRVAESLAQVSLPGIEAMWPASLSGGMRKRVGLARAIATRPEVVLYDEPTEGLDPINVTRVNRLLEALRQGHGVTTVVATQNMQSAFATSDRLALLHGGVAAKVGTPDELRAWRDPRIEPFVRASELRAKTRPSHPM
ncbi:MAG: ATP-binding cassette domain-containing protein [Myxococcales bacterium]|nr:ATP-binding cassette domain-containing protein [Myxococcales bacterium]